MGNEIKSEELSGNSGVNETMAPKTHLQYGVIAGLVLIVLFVLYYIMGWSFQTGIVRWIPSIAFMFIIILAQFSHAKAVEGNITFGNLFAKGFKTAAVATCIYTLFIVLFLLLAPAYKESMMEASRQGMVERGLSADQIKSAMPMVRKFFMVSVIAGAVIGELVVGLIASLVGAAVAPKDPKPQLPTL